jgi:hypothetical protein
MSPHDSDAAGPRPGDDMDDMDDMVVDFVLSSPEGHEYVLVLTEDRSWDIPGVIDHLTERVDRCVAYVLEGKLASDFPETYGRDIRIDVRYEHPLTTDVEALFLRFTEALSQRGIEFTAEPLGPDEG